MLIVFVTGFGFVLHMNSLSIRVCLFAAGDSGLKQGSTFSVAETVTLFLCNKRSLLASEEMINCLLYLYLFAAD